MSYYSASRLPDTDQEPFVQPETRPASAAATLVAREGVDRVAEEARLRALHALNILDTPPEPELDDLVQLAAAICGTPMSAISFVDQQRQWFKASVGLEVRETPREVAFCQHTIQQRGVMVVEDASIDPRFEANPLVTGELGLRFYAGMPLKTPEGHAIGSLCVLDRTPRSLSVQQDTALRVLAGQVNARLELREQRRALEEALQRAEKTRARAEALERRFQTFMDSGPLLACIKDAESHFLWVNKPLDAKLSILKKLSTEDDPVPRRLTEIYRTHDLEVLRTGQPLSFAEEMIEPDGTTRAFRAYKFPCSDESGRTLLGVIAMDVTDDLRHQAELKQYQTELERANRRLQDLASRDSLTQLSNRRVFDDELRLCFRKARNANMPLCVLMLDVDHFKSHNDRFGHAHGDDVLRTLAQQLKSNLRIGDTVARYGGEEFVILLPDTNEDGAAQVAQRLLTAIRRFPWPLAPVTVSLGLSSLTPAARDHETLTAWADQALYAAKCAGRDRMVVHAALQPAPTRDVSADADTAAA